MALRWIVLLVFVAAALYFLVGAIQTADFSVPASQLASEHYKKDAMQFLAMAGVCLLIGILLFVILLKKSTR